MVKDKVELCASELSDFTAFEGVGDFPLYKRYDVLREIIKTEVDEKYWHFLAQPVENIDAVITWHCIPYIELPRHIEELSGDEKIKYNAIKDGTISHYNQILAILKQQDKAVEIEYIEKSLKYIDDRFIYCFDEKVVLAIWGMKPKNSKNRISGEYSKDLFIKSINKPKYTITFNSGEQGTIIGSANITKEKDGTISFDEIPAISIVGLYEFIGWDENPVNQIVTENKTFNAQYKEKTITAPIGPSLDPLHKVTFLAGENGLVNGNPVIEVRDGVTLAASDIPQLDANEGFVFKGWNQNPDGYQVKNDTEFIAQYEKSVPVIPKRGCLGSIIDWLLLIPLTLWRWLKALWGSGCLKWLIGLLLLLLLLWLFSYLFKDCTGKSVFNGIVGGIDSTSNGNDRGNGNGDGSGTGHGNGGGYEFLPGNPGVIIPIDSLNFGYSKDSLTKIVSDRLNILLDGNATIPGFAKDFKNAYPSDEYQVVYYDTLIKRLQIKVPVEQREIVKQELPLKLSNYKLFIWDESLFESNVQLNDPALQDKDKSWYINACQVREAWNVTLGSSEVVVAIVDDGFDLKHPEFKGKIVKPYNVWSKSRNVYPSKMKHGTHVAGIALADGNNGIGISGIAPNCKFMPVQVADALGNMTITSTVDGVLYAIYSGADVINVSLNMELTKKSAFLPLNIQYGLIRNNFKEEERLWNEVFRIADEHNTTIVLAAGNENLLAGIDPMQRPTAAITVSAVDKAIKPYIKSSFSNYGEYSTLSAPGVQIYSTYGSNGYTYLDGTSMAAPIVTGAVALLKSINKKFTTFEIRTILVSTGIPVSGKIGNLIQLGKALNVASSGKIPKADSDNCDKIKREIDSLQKEIDIRLQWCPELKNNKN